MHFLCVVCCLNFLIFLEDIHIRNWVEEAEKKKKKLSLPLQKQQSFKCEKYKTTYIAAIAGIVGDNQSSMNHGRPRGQQSYLNIEITEAKNKSDQIGEIQAQSNYVYVFNEGGYNFWMLKLLNHVGLEHVLIGHQKRPPKPKHKMQRICHSKEAKSKNKKPLDNSQWKVMLMLVWRKKRGSLPKSGIM